MNLKMPRNGSHFVSASILWGRDKMAAPFKTIYSNWFSCVEWFHYFFKFDFNAFLNFQIEIYCIVLSSCTERGSNAVHRMTSLHGNVFPNVRTIGHRGFPAQRVGDTDIYLPAFDPFCPVVFVHICQKTTAYLMTCWQWFGFVLAMCIIA